MRRTESGRSAESILRPVAKTLNPCTANSVATPLPTPREAPVTNAVAMELVWAKKRRISSAKSRQIPGRRCGQQEHSRNRDVRIKDVARDVGNHVWFSGPQSRFRQERRAV